MKISQNTVMKLSELNRHNMIKKILASLLVFPLLVIPFMFKAEAEAPEPVIKTTWTVEEVKVLVNKYADTYGVSRSVLNRVVSCESQYNYKAVNWKDSHRLSNGSHGVAQFSRETFNGFAKKMGKDYYDDPYNPEQALDVMSWAISKGYGNHWSCY